MVVLCTVWFTPPRNTAGHIAYTQRLFPLIVEPTRLCADGVREGRSPPSRNTPPVRNRFFLNEFSDVCPEPVLADVQF